MSELDETMEEVRRHHGDHLSTPTDVVKEALREFVGDGEGIDETILSAHNEEIVRSSLSTDVNNESDGSPIYLKTLGKAVRPTNRHDREFLRLADDFVSRVEEESDDDRD